MNTRLRLGKLGAPGQLTSHVLDLSLGQPARGLALRLEVLEGGSWRPLGASVTDADGRAGDLLDGAPLESRTYRLTFETAAYFAATTRVSFYPRVEITFDVTAPGEHHHVFPLLPACRRSATRPTAGAEERESRGAREKPRRSNALR